MRNNGHSFEAMTPRRTSPQRHPLCSTVGSTSGANRSIASNAAYSSRIRYPDPGISPSPRHVEAHVSKTSSMAAKRDRVSLGHDAARWAIDIGAASMRGYGA